MWRVIINSQLYIAPLVAVPPEMAEGDPVRAEHLFCVIINLSHRS